MARASQRCGQVDGSRVWRLKKENHVSGGDEGLEEKEVPGVTGFWPDNQVQDGTLSKDEKRTRSGRSWV